MSGSAVKEETQKTAVETAEAPPGKVARGTRFGGGRDGGGREERGIAAGANWVGRTAQFLRDVRAEMRRVSWPTLNEVKNTTIITLIAVIFFATYLFLVDRVWAFLIERLRTLLGG